MHKYYNLNIRFHENYLNRTEQRVSITPFIKEIERYGTEVLKTYHPISI